MKYQKWKRVLSCLLAGLLVLGCLAGCGNQTAGKTTDAQQESTKAEGTEAGATEGTDATEEAKGITYPIEGNVKLTIAVVEEANVTATAKDLGETMFGKAWQEKTGVELEFITVPSKDAMGLLITGGEYPDIFLGYNSFPGGVEKNIRDGVIEPIGNYAEYCPDLMAALDENELFRKMASLNGVVYCAPLIMEDEYLQVSSGLMIRSDWLKDLGLDMPETADDLYNVLKAFKEKKGAEVPFSLTAGFLSWQGVGQGCLTSPFGLPNAYWYIDGDKIHYGYYEKEYKDVLEFLHKLYDEKLLDPNFQTLDAATVNANFMNGKSGVTMGAIGSGMGTYLETMKDDPKFDVAGFGPLAAEKGGKAMNTTLNSPVVTSGAYISGTCKNKEAAAMFLNYGYTEEGIKLFNFGTEGKSYNMVNGSPTYTDIILKPEGMTKVQALAHWTRIPQNGPFIQQREYMEQYNGLPQQQAALTSWSNSDAMDHYVPTLSMSSEDKAEYNKIMGDIDTYTNEMFIKYVTGIKSLDTFETEYLPTLEKMGMKRALELRQKALDAFNAQ